MVVDIMHYMYATIDVDLMYDSEVMDTNVSTFGIFLYFSAENGSKWQGQVCWPRNHWSDNLAGLEEYFGHAKSPYKVFEWLIACAGRIEVRKQKKWRQALEKNAFTKSMDNGAFKPQKVKKMWLGDRPTLY